MKLGNNVFEKFNRPQGPFHYDAWSDLVGGAFDSIGISPGLRDALQPAVNKASESLLPPGGAIPNKSAGADAEALPQTTGFKFQGNTNPMIYLGVGAAIVFAGFMLLKK